MTKEDFIAWALTQNWQLDRWGHLQKTRKSGKKYRFKVNKYNVRYEVKSETGSWVRLRSGYYKNLKVTSDNKLAGLSIW